MIKARIGDTWAALMLIVAGISLISIAIALGQGAVKLVSADPAPDEPTWIYDNQISMTFDQTVTSHSVEVVDSNGCKVNQRSEVSGQSNRVVVHMRACERMGYPGGHMAVRYTINGTTGEYHLHIRHHH